MITPSLLVSTPYLEAIFPCEALYPTLKAHSIPYSCVFSICTAQSLHRKVIFHQQYPAPVSTLPFACNASFLPLETSSIPRSRTLLPRSCHTPRRPSSWTTLPTSNFFSPPRPRLARCLPGSTPSAITSNVSPTQPSPLGTWSPMPPRLETPGAPWRPEPPLNTSLPGL